jgi:tetratricopeptide (TPR) repeat protein
MTESSAKTPVPDPATEQDPAAAREPGNRRPPQPAPAAPAISATAPAAGKGILNRLNPLKLFQRESPASLVRAGRELENNRHYAQATAAFTRALALDPNFAPAYEGLGDVLLKKGGRSNIEAAVGHLREAVKRDPFNDRAYAALGRAYDALGMRKEAALEKKKLVVARTLRADPNNPVANNNMGIMLLQQNLTTRGIEHLTRAMTADPRYDTAVRNLAIAFYKLANEAGDPATREQHLDKAKAYLAKALDIARSPLTLLAQARVHIMEERFEDALSVCAKVEEIDPAMKEVFALKKLVLMKLNRIDEANKAHETWRFLNAQE